MSKGSKEINNEMLKNFMTFKNSIKFQLDKAGEGLDNKIKSYILRQSELIDELLTNNLEKILNNEQNVSRLAKDIQDKPKFKAIYKILSNIDGVNKDNIILFYQYLQNKYNDELNNFAINKDNILFEYQNFINEINNT